MRLPNVVRVYSPARFSFELSFVLFIAFAAVIVVNILYVGTVIVYGKEDPAFKGDKLIYRS